MKGKKLEKVELKSIKILDKEFEYNDSKLAWNKLDETIADEKLLDR